MESNPICVQIPWDRNPEALAKWAEGRTGFPWIDAIMTQLRQEGWIHHLARHAVACFLTRGDLWIGWEEGMKVNKPRELSRLLFFFLVFRYSFFIYQFEKFFIPRFSSSLLDPCLRWPIFPTSDSVCCNLFTANFAVIYLQQTLNVLEPRLDVKCQLTWSLFVSPGVWGAAAGCRLECERRQLDVALLQLLLPAVLPLLLPRGLRPTHRPQRRLHTVCWHLLGWEAGTCLIDCGLKCGLVYRR